MAIYDLFLSRNNGPTIDDYVGHAGRLFYDSTSGGMRISDGATPGGFPLPSNPATSTLVGGIKPAGGFTVSADGTLTLNAGAMFELTGANVFNLKAATDTLLGGVKLGPGVTTNSEGQIIIDPEGLEFSFGDFASSVGTYAVGHPRAGDDYALLNSVNAEEDIVIASNGTNGVVKIIGDFSVRHTIAVDIDSILADEPIFRVSGDGQIRMLVPFADSLAGALEIIGNDAGTQFAPNQTGVLLHVTGNQGLVNRNYFDADDNYSLIAGRRYNGTVETPTGVLADQTIFRLVGQATTSDGTFKSFGPARISFYATENQTPTAQGGRIGFEVTKNGFAADGGGTNTVTAMSIDAQTGVTSTIGFVGNVTGSVTGNAGTVTNGVYTTSTGVVTNTMLAGNIANDKLVNSALTVGTTAISLGSSSTALAGMTNITFVAGSTTVAPIKLTAGSVLSSPAAGSVEYDGTVFYTTPNQTTRGMVESKMIYFNTAQVALANNGTQQSIFGLTNGVAVSYATRYRFKIMATVRVTADNVNLFFALGGTATYFRSNYNATVGKGAYGPGMMPVTVVEVYGTSDGQVKNTINISQGGVGGTYFQMNIEGFVDTQYSGYIKPIVLLSPNPGATSFIDSKSYMEIYPVGPAASGNADTVIGNWS